MDRAGIKEEFNAYVRNADLVSFEADKCRQYHYLTSSFVRRFEFSSSRNSQTVLFDLYENYYTMDLEDFTTACKLPQWGSIRDPRKSEFRDFLANITVGESRDITQATIGSIHFPAINYFALFIGRCRKVNAPYGSLCYISRFFHSYASKKISKFIFARIPYATPLWKFASSGKIL